MSSAADGTHRLCRRGLAQLHPTGAPEEKPSTQCPATYVLADRTPRLILRRWQALIFNRRATTCVDQIFTMNIDGTDRRWARPARAHDVQLHLSASLFAGRQDSLFSTHLADAACPPRPITRGLLWAVYSGISTFLPRSLDGSDLKHSLPLPATTRRRRFQKMGRNRFHLYAQWADLDIYSMDTTASHVKQLPRTGYDGGPFFSKDRKWIVYRAYHPRRTRRLPDTKSC